MSFLRSLSRFNFRHQFPITLRSVVRKNNSECKKKKGGCKKETLGGYPTFTVPCKVDPCHPPEEIDDCYRVILNASTFKLSEIQVKTHKLTVINVHAIQEKRNSNSLHNIDLQYVVPLTHDGQKLDVQINCQNGIMDMRAPKQECPIEMLYKHIDIQKTTEPCPTPCKVVPRRELKHCDCKLLKKKD